MTLHASCVAYTGYSSDLLRVERNMRLRRKRLLTVLRENEIAPTVAVFPMLGAMGDDGSVPAVSVGGPVTESNYIGDGIINPHPRFAALSANIRKRRGEKVNIRVPLFHDTNTPEYKDLTGYSADSCCGNESSLLWRYGMGDVSREKYGDGFVIVGCAGSAKIFNDHGDPVTLQKWLVNVDCEGCKGLYYRSAPGVIVADADWPRNGDIVVGSKIPNVPGKELVHLFLLCRSTSIHSTSHDARRTFCTYRRLDPVAKWLLSPHCE